MAKSFYIYSTLANGQKYQNWTSADGVNIPGPFVNIKGGAGIAIDGGQAAIWTPLGVCTEVTEDQMAILEANESFKNHVKLKFIVVREKKADAEKVAADMNRKDNGAPVTAADYANLSENEPKVVGALA